MANVACIEELKSAGLENFNQVTWYVMESL